MKQVFLFCTVLLLWSCQKEDSDDTSTTNDPACLLKGVDLFENPDPSERFTATYEGTNIKEFKSSGYTLRFTYNSSNQPVLREFLEPGVTGIAKDEFLYDNSGRLIEVREYAVGAGSPDEKTTYEYSNGKITRMKSFLLPANTLQWEQELVWNGENVAEVRFYDGGIMTSKFVYDYDLTRENTFNTKFKYYYWQDPSDDYETVGEALFFSKNQLVKATPSDPTESTEEVKYTFNPANQIRSIIISSDRAWTFKYTCD